MRNDKAKKDPAALFYIDKWLVATAEMEADCRGWFLNLILHQYDKGDLPAGIEALATLANVRFSEYHKFEQVFEQVLKHKFEQNERGRLENLFAKEILQGRETFKEKRSEAGRLSVFVKYVRENLCKDENVIYFIKKNADLTNVDLSNKQMLEQVFKQLLQLFINVNENVNINSKEEGVAGEEETPVVDEAAIVPRMFSVWKQIKPKYIARPSDDLPALAAILKIIFREQNLSLHKPGDAEQALVIWEEIARFINEDKHFTTYQLTQVNKYFASIASKFVVAKDAPQGTNGAKSTLHQNMQTAQGAADKIKLRFQNAPI